MLFARLLVTLSPLMQWTDKVRQVKIWLVVAAIVIAIVSLVVSHSLVRDMSKEEENNMKVWAEALHALNEADENTDISLVYSVIQSNSTIPLVVLDKDMDVVDYRNVDVDGDTRADSLRWLRALGREYFNSGHYIRIDLGDEDTDDCQYVCYDESLMLKRLAAYPYIQLGVVLIFVAIAILVLLYSKRAEQNKVWVGLSKETAHQLGTPISSLMAWVEILREAYPDDELIPEMNRDVERLQRVADRFSKIGSLPEPTSSSMNAVLRNVVEYMDRRTSKKVKIVCGCPSHEIMVSMNASLFEWVIENLCKNAVDAMNGEGRIDLTLVEDAGVVAVEVADNGKGIKKKDIKNVFKPGFTTKKRGWGLGLSLAKRIVEEYHKGKIYVKCSEVGAGTTFRIELRK